VHDSGLFTGAENSFLPEVTHGKLPKNLTGGIVVSTGGKFLIREIT
jgi:hypothetical protein